MDVKAIVDSLKAVCDNDCVITDQEILNDYGRDQTYNGNFPFDILVKPNTPQQISEILKIANRVKIPVTPRGGGSGVTGGALPVQGGIVLSLEKLNKILELNRSDKYVIVESGVITQELCQFVEASGLYYPCAPSSKFSSFVGGNVAENAGSINSCKYGTTQEYVLNLEVVLASGEILWTGANVEKNATGLNLTQLFVGSEGLLGIITKVVFKLVHKPEKEVVLLSAFSSLHDACNVISEMRMINMMPSGVELICRNAIVLTSAYLNKPMPLVNETVEAHLLLEFDGDPSQINSSVELATQIIDPFSKEDILVADDTTSKQKLRQLRLSIGEAMTNRNYKYRDIDVCLPPSLVYDYIRNTENICWHAEIDLVCFGHAWDGNMHTMLLFGQEAEEPGRLNEVLREIYRFAITKGGVISGEHGIGLLQKQFLEMQFTRNHLEIMRSLKAALDPNQILNPGKVF